jgi:hypothetical protein
METPGAALRPDNVFVVAYLRGDALSGNGENPFVEADLDGILFYTRNVNGELVGV